MLEVENLSIKLPTRHGLLEAVRDISFSVQEGETLGVVGESGCGKSLTSLAIMGLLPPKSIVTAKKLRFLGKDLLSMPEKQRRSLRGGLMSMIFQDPMTALNPSFTVGFQIMEALKAHGKLNKKERYQETLRLLEKVGISDPERRHHSFPHQLSGGMCQRIMIAMSMACRPKLLIADEPTTALDVTIQAQILTLLKQLQTEYQMGLLLISHNIGLVAQSADRIQIMYAGEIVEAGLVSDVLYRPQHPYTEGLLNSLPDHLPDEASCEVGPEVGQGTKGHLRLSSIPGMVPDLHFRPPGCQFHPRCHLKQSLCLETCPPLEVKGKAEGDSHHVRCHFPLGFGKEGIL